MGRPAIHNNPVKYPRYSRDQKLSVKIKQAQVDEIRSRYKNGEVVNALAREYGVSWTTIKMLVDEKFRKRRLKEQGKAYARWAVDNKERISRQTMRSRARKKVIQPQYVAYRMHKRFVSRRKMTLAP